MAASINAVTSGLYFPASRRERVSRQHVHIDPEFETFTYGDPTVPKRSLRTLQQGDYLVFYCGLQRWDEDTGWQQDHVPALYIIGYFVVGTAGLATEYSRETLRAEFRNNFHVRHSTVFRKQREHLVLVKGGPGSRLLDKAVQISTLGTNRSGKPLKILSPEMQRVFGDFGGRVSIQRSPPRWVAPQHVKTAIRFVESLK